MEFPQERLKSIMHIAPATIAPVKIIDDTAAKPIAYIIDDDIKICTLISRMLQMAGYAAIAFTKPDQCLKQLKAVNEYELPTVIILDLSLGATDGIEVLNELKAARFKNRVLLISGKDEATLQEVERMGADRGLLILPSLKKPFRLDDLKARLDITLDPVKTSPVKPLQKSSASPIDGSVVSGELIQRYQARMELKSGSLRGAEVVLYERHPVHGLVPLIISALPSNAPIFHPFSRLLLRTVLADWSRYLSDAATPIRFHIKLPLSVITTTTFLQLIRDTLSAYPAFPGFIIEVNDWQQLNNISVIRETSAQLKLYNVGLATDDVGALHSAMAESYKFPFEEFKLNAKFVSNCSVNETKQAMCKYSIQLAHDAGATVCAEGVTTRDELTTLIDMKCDTALGSLFGAPQPMDVFKANLVTPRLGNENFDTDPFAWPDAARA